MFAVAGGRSSEEFEEELAKRLDELDTVCYQSRDICGLRQQLKLADGGAGRAAARLTSSLRS